MSQSNKIETFIFLDTKSTGIPSLENNETMITELCLVAVQASHLRLGVVPRVQNKLIICFNPSKDISKEAAEITGLSNQLLEDVQDNLPSFSAGTVASINAFLDLNAEPVCLVAHIGNHFDFPLLHTEINRTESSLGENILCIDSIVAFQNIHFQDTRAKKISQETVPVALTEKALKLQKMNETTPKKQKITERMTDTAEFPFPSMMRIKGVRKNFRFKSGTFRSQMREKISQETVPIELTDNCDLLLCSVAEQLEQKYIEKALKVQKINEATPKKQKITGRMTDTAQFPPPPMMRTEGVRKKFRFKSGISFKLCDVYTRLTNRPPENFHQAEGNVLMLITCAATLGDRFVDWANLNARKFCDIPAMVPEKKIGT